MNILRILRNLLIILTGLTIMIAPSIVVALFIIAHDPQHAMGGLGGLLFALALLFGMGLVALVDRLLDLS